MVAIITHILGVNRSIGMNTIRCISDRLRCALCSSLDGLVLLHNLPGQLTLLAHLQLYFALNGTPVGFEIENIFFRTIVLRLILLK